MYKLKELKPEKVFTLFEEMSQIPRTSGDEKKISDWLVAFAKERNLEVYQDEALNVIIKKPGTAGYEDSPAVIIQGHMDMVGEKSKESTHDFSKDPINLRIDGDYVYATDTTLGADDGIAVAYGLAILDSEDIPHPPLELLITTSEETGMNGAIDLDASPLKGKVLLNIDAEEEGIFLVSCAGGNTVYTSFSAEYENESRKAYEIYVTGLKGGHSGIEINKQRGNAVKLLGRVLKRTSREMDIRIASISGGAKHNAIAREAVATITVPEIKVSTLKGILDEMNKLFVNEFASEDPEIVVGIKESSCERVMSEKTTNAIINYMNIVPDGVQTISREIEGLVVSSLNLGVLEEKEDKIIFTHAVRSSVKSLKEDISNKLMIIAELCGGTSEIKDNYPEWQYTADSKVREVAISTYKELTGEEPKIEAIHAGLECGLLKEKLPEADMIAFGPNLYDVHTPQEHMSISSVARTFDFLKALLGNLK